MIWFSFYYFRCITQFRWNRPTVRTETVSFCKENYIFALKIEKKKNDVQTRNKNMERQKFVNWIELGSHFLSLTHSLYLSRTNNLSYENIFPRPNSFYSFFFLLYLAWINVLTCRNMTYKMFYRHMPFCCYCIFIRKHLSISPFTSYIHCSSTMYFR